MYEICLKPKKLWTVYKKLITYVFKSHRRLVKWIYIFIVWSLHKYCKIPNTDMLDWETSDVLAKDKGPFEFNKKKTLYKKDVLMKKTQVRLLLSNFNINNSKNSPRFPNYFRFYHHYRRIKTAITKYLSPPLFVMFSLTRSLILVVSS